MESLLSFGTPAFVVEGGGGGGGGGSFLKEGRA